MSPIQLLRDQRTIRKYQDRVPDEQMIRDAVALAQRSPSTSNHQPYCVISIQDPELRRSVLSAMVCQAYVLEAPVLLLVCVDWSRQDALAKELGVVNQINRASKLVVGIADASIFAHSMVLAFQAFGLAASYIASPYTALMKVAELLNIPTGQAMPLHMISVGYANESPGPRPRYPLDRVLHQDSFKPIALSVVREYFRSGSAKLEQQGYFVVTGDEISTWREHYRIKFGSVAEERTWNPLERDLAFFFSDTGSHGPF